MVEAADAEEEEGGEGGRVLPFNLSCSPVIFYSTNSIAAGLLLLAHWKLTFSFLFLLLFRLLRIADRPTIQVNKILGSFLVLS